MKPNKITHITIQRELRAGPYGFSRETVVYISRDGKCTRRFSTNDILKRGNISEHSVRRAKRAQVAIVERAQAEKYDPAVIEFAKMIYNANHGNVSFADCIERAL